MAEKSDLEALASLISVPPPPLRAMHMFRCSAEPGVWCVGFQLVLAVRVFFSRNWIAGEGGGKSVHLRQSVMIERDDPAKD